MEIANMEPLPMQQHTFSSKKAHGNMSRLNVILIKLL
jgi:hypothetical protein